MISKLNFLLFTLLLTTSVHDATALHDPLGPAARMRIAHLESEFDAIVQTAMDNGLRRAVRKKFGLPEHSNLNFLGIEQSVDSLSMKTGLRIFGLIKSGLFPADEFKKKIEATSKAEMRSALSDYLTEKSKHVFMRALEIPELHSKIEVQLKASNIHPAEQN